MREALERRPALLLCAGLILGLTVPSHPLNLVLLPLFLFVAKTLPGTALVSSAFLLGLLLSPKPASTIPERAYLRGIGTVASMPRLYASRNAQALQPGMTACDFELRGRTYLLQVPGWPDIGLGDRLEVAGVATPLREGEEYLLARGVSARLRVEASDVRLARRAPWPLRIAALWRQSFVAFSGNTLNPAEAADVDAMCFNVDTLLDEETMTSLERTGTVHIISASGLHALAFAVALQWLLAAFPVPRWAQLALLGLVLAVYACAAGLHPPIVRATLIVMLGACAYLVRREPDLLSALGIAAALYLLWKPASVYSLGFQLSFVTVAAFALFLHRDEEAPPKPLTRLLHDLWSLTRATVVATLATMPLLAHAFGYVSIISVVANVLVLAAVSVAIVAAMAAHGVSGLLPGLAQGTMSLVVSPLVGWLHLVLDGLGRLPWAVVRVPHFDAYWLPLIYGAALLTWRRRIVQP